MRPLGALLLGGFLFCAPNPGGETLVQVSQPIFLNEAEDSKGDRLDSFKGATPVITEVTYLLSASPKISPETEVRLTVEPSADSWNRNAASLFQLRLRFPDGAPDSSGARSPGLFGDTLVVVLDLSDAMKTKVAETSPDQLNEVVGQTAQCLLLNARRRWPRIRHLALSIDGSHAHEHWEAVHSLENAPGTAQKKIHSH